MSILTEPFDAEATSRAGLSDRYMQVVVERARTLDRDRLTTEGGVSPASLEGVEAGDVEAVTVADAVRILAVADGTDPDAAIAALRDHLLLAMSGAMMDVEALASAADLDLEPGAVQAKVEGRLPMSLAEYARLRHAIARHGG